MLIGIISFFICEKLVTFANKTEEEEDDVDRNFETDLNISDSSNNNVANHVDKDSKNHSKLQQSSHNKHVSLHSQDGTEFCIKNVQSFIDRRLLEPRGKRV